MGAKLFSIVLLPLLCLVEFSNRRWVSGAALGVMTVFVAAVSLFQMFWDIRHPPADQVAVAVESQIPPIPTETADNSPSSVADGVVPQSKSDDGLSTFLSRWEMNDLIFMAMEENIREPEANEQGDHWFVILPRSWRIRASQQLMDWTGLPPYRIAFVTTRLLTLLLFGGVVLLVSVQACLKKDASAVLEAAFLVLAWFWLLAPTQNPWYWTWALPFVVFARNRTWLLVGGVSLVYYLRFWLLYHYSEPGFWGTGYTGPQFFDFVVVWGEFGPFLVLLFLVWLFRRNEKMPSWLYRTTLDS